MLSAVGVRSLVHHPTWAGLRTLTLTPYGSEDHTAGLADCTLPDLTDLRLHDGDLSAEAFRALARLPLLSRLRHLRVVPPPAATDAEVLALADALDPGRLETLSFGGYFPPDPLRAELLRRFDDRIRGWRGRL